MKMTDENLLMEKCLNITSHILDKDQRAFISIKIGTSVMFTFNNQEPSTDGRRKSPYVISMREKKFLRTRRKNIKSVNLRLQMRIQMISRMMMSKL